MLRAISVFALALVCCAKPAFAAGPYNPFKVGNWNGGAYTNDQTGAFSHCAASVPYNSGISLFVSITSNGEWLLAFSNNQWTLTTGTTIPINLTFDGRTPVQVNAFAKSPVLAAVNMPIGSELINAFRGAHIMNAYAAGHLFLFTLNGTSKLFPLLVTCSRNQGRPVTAMRVPQGRPAAAPAPTPTAPPINQEAAAERSKLIKEAADDHAKCERAQMQAIVPYSNESAEVLAQVVLTKCQDTEEKFVSTGMALFNVSRAEMEKVVSDALAKQKARWSRRS